MTTNKKNAGWRTGGFSWKRVGVVVLTISGVALLAGIVSVHRAGIPQSWETAPRYVPHTTPISLAGTVYDASGEVRAGAEVYLALWAGKPGHLLQGATVADASGGYGFPNLVGYDPEHVLLRSGLFAPRFCVFAHSPGQGFGSIELEPTHDRSDADIRLHPEHRVSGMVTDVTGNPIGGASIDLRGVEVFDATGEVRIVRFNFQGREPRPPFLFTLTNADGGFVLPGIPGEKNISLDVSAPGYFGQYLQDVSTDELVSITLRKELKLIVKVVLGGGEIRFGPDARLNILKDGDGRMRVVSFFGGWFRTELETGHYGISLVSEEFEADPVEVHLTLESSGRPVIIQARKIPREGQ